MTVLLPHAACLSLFGTFLALTPQAASAQEDRRNLFAKLVEMAGTE